MELLFEGRVKLYLSTSMLKEYTDVLNRPKFSAYPEFRTGAVNLLGILKVMATTLDPVTRLDVCADDGDNKFVELAIEADADYLITGNRQHFPYRKFQDVQIVSPAEFLRSRRG